MNDLEIAKRIAEIEGVEFECTEYNENFPSPLCVLKDNGYEYEEYTPFEWSILGPLMIKYKVEIDFDIGVVGVWVDKPSRYFSIDLSSEKEIPRAILECIIKSQECK